MKMAAIMALPHPTESVASSTDWQQQGGEAMHAVKLELPLSADDDRLSVRAPPTPCASSDGSEMHQKGLEPTGGGGFEYSSSAAPPLRSCAHCRTLKTPLWRNGPSGPKTLCNACGVRFKLGKLQVAANGMLEAVSHPAVSFSKPRVAPAAATASSRAGSQRRAEKLQGVAKAPLHSKRTAAAAAARSVKSEHAAALLLLALADSF